MLKKRLPLALCLMMWSVQGPGWTQGSAAQEAFRLYNAHQYAAAADSFDRALRTGSNAKLCYYAALSNQAGGRAIRARQLFQYLVSAFPGTTEAAYAKQVLAREPQQPIASTGNGGSLSGGLPESVKNALPPEMQGILNSAMGKKAIEQVMRDHPDQISTIREAEQKGLMKQDQVATLQNRVASATFASGLGDARSHGDKEHPFTPEDIARDGANGIDQMRYPNCWFESSMAALAELPRGQKLLSSLIRYGNGPGSYVVRFPGDGNEYKVSRKDMEDNRINDKALWASLIECAQIQKFPDNRGAEGSDGDQSRLEVGLGCISGRKAEILYPAKCTLQELSSFIGGALKSQNPVVAGTYNEYYMPAGPLVVFPLHAYTVVGFDPSRNMVTLRNPHGTKSRRFPNLANDPKHEEFEQLDGGLCKMSLGRFQKCFYSAARSFI